MKTNFADRLCDAIREKKSLLCPGLDPQLRYMPPHLMRKVTESHGLGSYAIGQLFSEFNFAIIDNVRDLAPCVKLNMAFYERYGHEGVSAFERTVDYARTRGLLVVGDVKRGDGGDTVDAYADGYLGEVPFINSITDVTSLSREASEVRVDCATVHGYIAEDCVIRFINVAKEYGTGIFVVVKTSFKPNSAVEQLMTVSGMPVWQELAHMVQEWGKGTEGEYGIRNVGVVVGATYPEDAPKMREILPNSIFLKPGFGGQGAGATDAIAGIRKDGFGVIVNDSRSLTFAWQDKKGKYQCAPENFAEAARLRAIDARDQLNAAARSIDCWPHS